MSGLLDCRHKPPCPITASRWRCGRRTQIELAVNRGVVERDAARRLLAGYGVPMTPLSRVYRGDAPPAPEQGKLR